MGKAKQRILGRGKNDLNKYDITRRQAIDFVVNELVARPTSLKAKKMISLFGLNPEELTEAGMEYECVSVLERSLSIS